MTLRRHASEQNLRLDLDHDGILLNSRPQPKQIQLQISLVRFGVSSSAQDCPCVVVSLTFAANFT